MNMNDTIDATKTYSLRDAAEAFPSLHDFLGRFQIDTLADRCRNSSEERWFRAKVVEIAGIVKAMPKSYETDGQGLDAVAHLHYFLPNADWYITEKDIDTDGQGQIQAFGMACMSGYDSERGYISIKEITRAGAELDLHWEPRALREIKERAGED